MSFNDELKFEEALTQLLCTQKGWSKDILKNPTEDDLIKNWANILFQNNKQRDRLNGYPLTDSEMQQIISQINTLRTPLKLNGFINGKTISITRDNPDDKENFGKSITLKIYDKQEIAGGSSVYQIARQPIFKSKSPVLRDRRGDVMLLINGMPLIHIELKRSGVPVSEACNQIEKYTKENVFSGIFQLIQVFVAMTPEETVYFANPGVDGVFNPNFYFHWADFKNIPVNQWQDVAGTLLHIPMAHELIGFYSIADNSDGILKVMRSYQYYAASQVASVVAKNQNNWCKQNQRGGFISACTGSGKTMTSFKAAQLIAKAGNADKIVFLVDRTELGTQSLDEYRSFSDASDSVQATEDTEVLISRLKSSYTEDTLIVTSIQKMSRIKDDTISRRQDLEKIQAKRIVFIIDECHRSVYGEMLQNIKDAFPNAMRFGFSGTPIMEENKKFGVTTSDIFGNELHVYTLSDGIRDKNVLGFDNYKVCTFKDSELRKAVALRKADAKTVEEARSDEHKQKIFEKYMDKKEFSMIDIEKEIPMIQYDDDIHRNLIVENILESWDVISYNGKYHGLLATHSIKEAIAYYRLFKRLAPDMKVTSLFDEHDNNDGRDVFKEDGIAEIITDYNNRYKKTFKLSSYKSFKKDVCLRLAHKKPYGDIHKAPDQTLDLVIVVDQLLTGFDSKYINALYLDKMLENEKIIQAFSRTNRVFTPDKKFGVIKWYRKPHTMEKKVEKAIQLYSKDRKLKVFVEKLDMNIAIMNRCYENIVDIFKVANIENFERLPDNKEDKLAFGKQFAQILTTMEASVIQGFKWTVQKYEFEDNNGKLYYVEVLFDKHTYDILYARFRELFDDITIIPKLPYNIKGYLVEYDAGLIDIDYVNSRFQKYIKVLSEGDKEIIETALNDLHKSFASLTQEQQECAKLFLHDVESGSVVLEDDKTILDYINEYQMKILNDNISKCAKTFGLDYDKLNELVSIKPDEHNINEFGRYDALKSNHDIEKIKAYFEAQEGKELTKRKAMELFDKFLRKFILTGGFRILEPTECKTLVIPKNIYEELDMSYDDYVAYLLDKYGCVKYDYFTNENCNSKNSKITRTGEGLFCHHIDENKTILLAEPTIAKMHPFEYQKSHRLVYCNYFEHLLLHIKIVKEAHEKVGYEDAMVGIGGAEMLWQQINGCYRNAPKDGWRKNVFDVIKDRYDDYIVIMKYIKQFVEDDVCLYKNYSDPKLATDWDGKTIEFIHEDIYR